MSASGSTTMWFLAPPSACTRLPWRVPGLVHVARHRGAPDERHRVDVGVGQQRVDRFGVALHDVDDAVGEAGAAAPARRGCSDADGSFSDGFSTNAFPQAMALASIHSGTITGKLNGVMPATTPERLQASCCTSMPGGHLRADVEPFSSCGMPHANSTYSMPRATSPCASSSTLPCSLVTIGRELVAVGVEQLAEREQHPTRRAQRRRTPLAGGVDRDLHRVVDLGGGRERDLGGLHAPGGVEDRPHPTGRRPLPLSHRSSARSCLHRSLHGPASVEQLAHVRRRRSPQRRTGTSVTFSGSAMRPSLVHGRTRTGQISQHFVWPPVGDHVGESSATLGRSRACGRPRRLLAGRANARRQSRRPPRCAIVRSRGLTTNRSSPGRPA